MISLFPPFVVILTAVSSVAALHYGPIAVLRLVAGITVIFGHDKQTKAHRALEVLRALRGDDQAPPNSGSPE